MKRIVTPLCLLICILILLSGCGGAAKLPSGQENADAGPGATISVSPLDLEEPAWPVLSVAPEDYGIVYDAKSIEHLPEYPLDKLMAYCLGADGAFAEGAFCELYRRFLDAPGTVLTAIALIGDEMVRGTPARDLLCRAIASSAAWSGAEAFGETVKRCEEAYPTGRAADVLTNLKEQYAAAQNAAE